MKKNKFKDYNKKHSIDQDKALKSMLKLSLKASGASERHFGPLGSVLGSMLGSFWEPRGAALGGRLGPCFDPGAALGLPRGPKERSWKPFGSLSVATSL